MTKNLPLVCIGMPTYNRVEGLRRAIESVLAQDHSNWEIWVSDNASTDGTEALCREYCSRDNRIHYFCHEKNKGPTANFIYAQQQGHGKYFMWLADDDWIDRSYISQCAQILERHDDYVVVGGKPKFFKDDQNIFDDVLMNIPNESGVHRVINFYKQLHYNGIFYGVIRQEQLDQTSDPRNLMAGDLLFTASLVFLGKIATLENTSINREFGGASVSSVKIAQALGLNAFQAKHPNLSHTWFQFSDIIKINPAYHSLPLIRRFYLATYCALIIAYRFIWLPRIDQNLYAIKAVKRNIFIILVAILHYVIPRALYLRVRGFYRKISKKE